MQIFPQSLKIPAQTRNQGSKKSRFLIASDALFRQSNRQEILKSLNIEIFKY
jgi:hypothetical protein